MKYENCFYEIIISFFLCFELRWADELMVYLVLSGTGDYRHNRKNSKTISRREVEISIAFLTTVSIFKLKRVAAS